MTSVRHPNAIFRLGQLAATTAVLLAGAAWTAEPSTTAEPEQVVYEPPDLGAPKVRTGAVARGVGELPTVLVLAPPELARTMSTQPTLYWFLSGPSMAPARLTVQDLDAVEPLLEVELGEIEAGGVHATALADHGVTLEPGHSYEWSVALTVNDPSAWSVAGTILTVAEADPELLAKTEGARPEARAEALAAAGYWYDLIDLISREIAAGDDPEAWRALRAALLEQEAVGLDAVAEYDQQPVDAQ